MSDDDDEDDNERRIRALGERVIPVAEAWHKHASGDGPDPFAGLDREQLLALCRDFATFVGVEGPEPLLQAYEHELAAHNALLDEIESFAGSDSVDVKLVVELVKHKRPARSDYDE
jgi:hypothetical protein